VSDPTYRYNDASSLARWASWLLYAQVALAVAAIWSGWQFYQLLEAVDAGRYTNDASAIADAEVSDRRQQIIGLAQAGVFIATGIVILMWIYRANANARALGAQRMSFTPGWSVGWYFVPLANLVMPYQALQETWKASARPHDPEGATVAGWWFPAWWFFWLASNIAANVGFRFAWDPQSIDDLKLASSFTLVSDALTIPLCLAFPVIVAQIQRMQTTRADARSVSLSSVPA
jgi:hypothetical protein